MNTAVAPEPETKSTPLGLSAGMGLVNTEWWSRVSSPMQLGPMSAAPYCSQVSRMRCSMTAPALVSSPKPAEMMMNARVPLSRASSSTVSGHNLAGTTRIASSVGGSSLASWNTLMPCTSSSFGFTTRRVPLNPPCRILRMTAPPGLWTLLDPPMTTMLWGCSSSRLIILLVV